MKRPRLDAQVRELHQVSWGKARDWISSGKIHVDGQVVTDPGFEPGDSARIELRMNAPRNPARAASERSSETDSPRILYSDPQIAVVFKPPGMSTVPFEKRETGSLEQWLAAALKPSRVTVVHRIDRETSGLLVFARNPEAGRGLANQFRFHSVHRRYLALAHGQVRSQTIRSRLVLDRGDGLRGSAVRGRVYASDEVKEAITHVEAIATFSGMTLIACQLETGRTHQIRIHLSEAGHPLLGERLYIREFDGTQIPAPRLMLHAAELGIMHPVKNVRMDWNEPPPQDFRDLLPPEFRDRNRFVNN